MGNFVILGTAESERHETAEATDSWIATRELGAGGQGVAYLARRLTAGCVARLDGLASAVADAGSRTFAGVDSATDEPFPDPKVRLVREVTCLLAADWDPREYVVKFFVPRPGETGSTHISRWRREVKALREVDHPNVVSLIDAGRVKRASDPARDSFSVYPYYSGGSLFDQRHRFQGSLIASLRVIIDVLKGVEALHARGTCHRDVTPRNVFLHADGAAVLGDFGLVSRGPEDTAITKLGAGMGAWQFAPAWRRYDADYEPDHAFDLYMTCTTLWCVLGGVVSDHGLTSEDLDEPGFNLAELIPGDPLVADVKEVLRRVLVKRRPLVVINTASALRAAFVGILRAAELQKHAASARVPGRCHSCSEGRYERVGRPLTPGWVESLHETGCGQDVQTSGKGTSGVDMFRCNACGHLATYARPQRWNS